jgi:hypothetical protein
MENEKSIPSIIDAKDKKTPLVISQLIAHLECHAMEDGEVMLWGSTTPAGTAMTIVLKNMEVAALTKFLIKHCLSHKKLMKEIAEFLFSDQQ